MTVELQDYKGMTRRVCSSDVELVGYCYNSELVSLRLKDGSVYVFARTPLVSEFLSHVDVN